jgi:hypothetical protein
MACDPLHEYRFIRYISESVIVRNQSGKLRLPKVTLNWSRRRKFVQAHSHTPYKQIASLSGQHRSSNSAGIQERDQSPVANLGTIGVQRQVPSIKSHKFKIS